MQKTIIQEYISPRGEILYIDQFGFMYKMNDNNTFSMIQNSIKLGTSYLDISQPIAGRTWEAIVQLPQTPSLSGVNESPKKQNTLGYLLAAALFGGVVYALSQPSKEHELGSVLDKTVPTLTIDLEDDTVEEKPATDFELLTL